MGALVALGVAGACSKAPPPGEDVGSSTGPPIVVCHEPDGALCPLDAGDDGGDASYASDAGDATATVLADADAPDGGPG